MSKAEELKERLKTLTPIVMEGVDYFQSGRLEELKTDDQFYITTFIKMIGVLSAKLKSES